MENTVFRECTNLHYGTIRLFNDGQVGYSYNRWNLPYRFRNNIPCVTFGYQSACGKIDDASFINKAYDDETLYIEPKARIYRDLLRNSGFKITRSPEKADVIVIPEPDEYDFYCTTYDFIAYNCSTSSLYAFDLQRRWNESIEITEEKIDAIKNKLTSVFGELEFFYLSQLQKINLSFIPPVESYFDIIESEGNNKYVSDIAIEYEPTNEVNVETLEVWSRISDEDIFAKCLVGSDWKKYPYTLKCFLEAEYPYRFREDRITSRNLKMVVHYINESPNNSISAEDWNMLQSWVMHKLGIENCDKAWVNYETYDSLDSVYKNVIRAKMAVSPVLISESMSRNNILEQIRKS